MRHFAMRPLVTVSLVAAPAALCFLACSGDGASSSTGATTSSTSTTTSSAGVGGAGAACTPCQADSECAAGAKCGQFGGDTFCAPDCSTQPTCSADRMCVAVSGVNGAQLSLCLPRINVCGTQNSGDTTTTTTTSAAATSSSTTASSSSGNTCGSLLGPNVAAGCHACKPSSTCQPNGCYNGWWCNTDTVSCQVPPDLTACGGTSSSSSSSAASSSSGAGGSGPIGATGGTVPTLRFAIVGDTRPANNDDTAGYPTSVITKIWQDLEAYSPRPDFAVTTGDYMFASAKGTQSGPQLDLYINARKSFSNVVFPAMGNHECTGATVSECGQGNPDGITTNYTSFMTKMLAPLGQTLPYYTINVSGTGGAWTAKFVFIACNAWTSTQSTWLDGELAKPTTYTFVVRHEGNNATTPCVAPTGQIMGQHPLTMLIAGHTHTFAYYAGEKEVIVGNGGAPLTGNVNYGYVVAEQQADKTMTFKSFDYSTNALVTSFTVAP